MDWSHEECLGLVADSGQRRRYYCNPDQAFFDEETGEEVGTGVCSSVSHAESGPYRPNGPDGLAYPAPNTPEFDSFTSSTEECAATCGDFACVYLPVGDTVARGCSRLPVVMNDTTLYPPEYLPSILNIALDGLTLSAVEKLVPYHLARLRPGAKTNEEGAFDTEKLCSLACPPCIGAKCFGIR